MLDLAPVREEVQRRAGEGGGRCHPGESRSEGEEEEEPRPPTRARTSPPRSRWWSNTRTRSIKPLKATALRARLTDYATKLEKARSPEKQKEYKLILKGIEIGAGLSKG